MADPTPIPSSADAFIADFQAARSRVAHRLVLGFPALPEDGAKRAALRADLKVLLRFLDALDLAHGTQNTGDPR